MKRGRREEKMKEKEREIDCIEILVCVGFVFCVFFFFFSCFLFGIVGELGFGCVGFSVLKNKKKKKYLKSWLFFFFGW